MQPWGGAQQGGRISVLGNRKTLPDKPCCKSVVALLWAGDQTGDCVSFSICYIPVVGSSVNAFGALGINEWPHQRRTSWMSNDVTSASGMVCCPILGHWHARSTCVSLLRQLLSVSEYLPCCSAGAASLASCAWPGEIGPVHAQIEMPLIAYEMLYSVWSMSSISKSCGWSYLLCSRRFQIGTKWSVGWKGSDSLSLAKPGTPFISIFASNEICFVSGNCFSFWSQRFDKENPYSAYGYCSNERAWKGSRNVDRSTIQFSQILCKYPRAPENVAGQYGKDTCKKRRLFRGNSCH